MKTYDGVEVTDGHPRDKYGRPFGLELWKGGPILGGRGWRAFADQQARRKVEEAPLPRLRPDRGVWE